MLVKEMLEELEIKMTKQLEKLQENIAVKSQEAIAKYQSNKEDLEVMQCLESLALEVSKATDIKDLKEVEEKMKEAMSKTSNSNIIEKAENILKKIKNIKESAPIGSVENLRERINEALQLSGLFPEKDLQDKYISCFWIRYLFLDKVIVCYNEKNYLVAYSILDGVISFGEPKEVVEEYIVKEVNLNESNGGLISKTIEEELFLDSYIDISESTFDQKSGELENVILIEAGTNPQKRRHYPVETIQEAAPHFSNMKMYRNHPTKSEEIDRPERDLKDWMSTIVESKAIGGKAVAKVKVHDSWLKERLADPIARKHIGLSINAGGRVTYGKVNGEEMQIVEKIVFARKNGPVSVDWVTEAGARGRVVTSPADIKESARNKDIMEDFEMFENIKLKELKEKRPDLIESIVNEVKESITQSSEALKKEQELKEAQAKIAAFENEKKIAKQNETVESLLKESSLIDVAKERVRQHFAKNLVDGDLKESVQALIAEEVKYLNAISGKGKIVFSKSNDGQTSLVESTQQGLDEMLGVSKKEEK